MLGGLTMRRLAYYAVVVVGSVAVHAGFFADVAGAEVADFLRRNSEAYVLMALVPAFWDTFAWELSPSARRTQHRRDNPRPWSWHAAWLATLGICALVTQTSVLEDLGVELPQSVITLGEAFVATIVISIYLAWTHGLYPSSTQSPGGAPVVPWEQRLIYYAVVGTLAVLGSQSLGDSVVARGVTDWLELNAEALGAALLIPLYFDVVARAARPVFVRVVWYGALALVPILAQSGALDGVSPGGLVDWLTRITEAFLAAIVIALYFDVWRGRGSHEGEFSDQ